MVVGGHCSSQLASEVHLEKKGEDESVLFNEHLDIDVPNRCLIVRRQVHALLGHTQPTILLQMAVLFTDELMAEGRHLNCVERRVYIQVPAPRTSAYHAALRTRRPTSRRRSRWRTWRRRRCRRTRQRRPSLPPSSRHPHILHTGTLLYLFLCFIIF